MYPTLKTSGPHDVMLNVLVCSYVSAAMAESWMPSQICLQFEGAALQKRGRITRMGEFCATALELIKERVLHQ
jgi:hypothetical protein